MRTGHPPIRSDSNVDVLELLATIISQVATTMHKRKHRRTDDQGTDKLHTHSTSINDTAFASDFDPSLYIVAHEADIVSGPRAVAAALALECPEALPDGVDKTGAGSGLIPLEPQHTLVFEDDDDDGEGSNAKAPRKPRPSHLLVDRYVFLILKIFPRVQLSDRRAYCQSEGQCPGGDSLLCDMNVIGLSSFLDTLRTRLRERRLLRVRRNL